MLSDCKRIDCHTHSGICTSWMENDKYPHSFLTSELILKMYEHNFDCAIVFPFPSANYAADRTIDPLTVPYQAENKQLINEVEQFKNDRVKLLPFPMFSVAHAIDEQIRLLEAFAQKGMIFGLKYYPDMDKLPVSTLFTQGKPFIDFLLKYNLPLTIHTSENATLSAGYSSPTVIVQEAKKFPKLRVAIAHMGHFNAEAINTVIREHITNVFFDVSPLLHICHIRTINSNAKMLDLPYSQPVLVLEELCRMLPDQLLWGSDAPFNFTCNLNNPNHNKDVFRFSVRENVRVLESISESNMRLLCTSNPKRFLIGE